MATDLDQAYQRCSQEEFSDADESHDVSVSQMLDHGSISFGRFPIESLSWERRSVFTHNRCQEELEKFNGLVAKKKAYFEERYRRIRALKAQQNQQTVLTLDYSGEGSISSQSGDEGGATTQHESLREGAENVVHAPPEDVQSGTAFQQDIHCNETPQERCLDPKSTLPNLTSSRGVVDSTEQDKTSADTVIVQPLETESSLPLTADMEETESNFSSNIDNNEVLRRHANLAENLEPIRITQGTKPDTNKTNLHKLQPIRKSLDDKLLSNVKEPASVGNHSNVKRETKVNVVHSSRGLRTSSQKMISQTLNKTATSRVKSNAGSTLVTSNRQNAESRSNISNPGPFTLVMERRANSRGTAAKFDSGGSKMLVASQSHPKSSSNVQGSMKKTAVTSGTTKRTGTETKRDLKEVRTKPLVVDSRHTSLKKTEARVPGPSKSRSVNLPARIKSTSNCGTGSQIATAEEIKQREGNANIRGFQRAATKTSIPSTSEKLRTAKPLAIRETGMSRSGRKPRFDDLSLDGRKTRRGTPQWR